MSRTTPIATPMAGQSHPPLRSQPCRKIDDHLDPATIAPATQNKPMAMPPESLPTRDKDKIKPKRARCPFQPIQLMKGHNQFDFIKSFRNAPVADITWGVLINLAPTGQKGHRKGTYSRVIASQGEEGTDSRPHGRDRCSRDPKSLL